MKRKLLFALIALLVAITSAQASTLIDGLYYNLDTGTQTAEVTYEKYYYSDNYSYVSGDLVIPETVTYNNISYFVTSIGGYAFYHCDGLTSVTIPESVTSIGDRAFGFCSSLTSVTIPESVTSIEGSAFSSCSWLTTINVEESNTVYDSRDNCNAIIETATNTLIAGCMNTIIPENVTSIGNYAFEGCSGLTSVIIPNSVTEIGLDAFSWCSSLTSVIIPNSVTSIGRYAFEACNSLTAVHISDIAAWCNIKYYDYYDNPLYYAGNLYLNGELVTDLIIPESVETIKAGTFLACRSLTSVTIPNSVTNIGWYAFLWCESLSSIYNYAEVPQSIDEEVFISEGETINKSCVLYVPKESVEAYKNAPVWKDFYQIVGIDIPEDEDTAVGDVFNPNNLSATKKVIENGHIYLLTPDGKKLTLQGAESEIKVRYPISIP